MQSYSWTRRLVRFSTVAVLLLLLPLSGAKAQKVPPGFKVELLYQVPEIEHPSSVTCDDQGNLFISEDPMDMRGPSTDPIDRILLVRWDKKTGKQVKTVFCDNLSVVFGMLWHKDALYVIEAPHYIMLKDTDGDGVADVRKQLADGFGHKAGQFGLNNHYPSGMHLGMDGMIYISVGDKGIPKATGADGSTITLEGGGIFRMRPDGTQLEVVSSGSRNHLDGALDRFDNIFAYCNDDDLGWWTRLIHHVPTGYYGYPYDQMAKNGRYLPPIAELGSGTTCGGACYREAKWPTKFRGNAFFCEWGESKIESFTLTKKGASFELKVEDFMLADDLKEFRPIDLCFSPDGRHMFVADWNSGGGGKKQRAGRIFRVTYVGDDESNEPERGTNAELLDEQLRALGHPSHDERMRAQHRLAEMGAPAANSLAKLLASDGQKMARVHALWAQNGLIGHLDNYDPVPHWIKALEDPDADIRGQAARALGLRREPKAKDALAEALGDSDAAVRLRVAVALGRIGHVESAEPLFAALDESDQFARFTMLQAIRAIGNWEPGLSHLDKGSIETRATILRAATTVYDRGAVELLANWSRRAPEVTERIVAMRALAEVRLKADPYTGGWWGGKPAKGKPSRPKIHTWDSTAAIEKAIAEALQQDAATVRLAALEILREAPSTDLVPTIRRLAISDPDEGVRQQSMTLLASLKDTEIVKTLLKVVTDRKSSDVLRKHAIEAVVAIGAEGIDDKLAEVALAKDVSISLASVAFDGLATLQSKTALAAIEKRMNGASVPHRALAIKAYGKNQGENAIDRIATELDSKEALIRRAALTSLGSLEARRAVPAMISLTTDVDVQTDAFLALCAVSDRRALKTYLDGLLHENKAIHDASASALDSLGEEIAPVIRSLFDRNELPASLRRELIKVFPRSRKAFAFLHAGNPAAKDPTAYSKYAIKNRGDAKRGQKLFADTKGIGCAKCHAVGGVGANVGPDLLGVGAKYPRAELIRSVLEPSSRILTDYEMFVIVTDDGKIHQGIIKSQTPEAIELVTGEAKVIRIPTDDIEAKKKSTLSPMPNGLSDGMTLKDFADIIAYLESLKQPKGAGEE